MLAATSDFHYTRLLSILAVLATIFAAFGVSLVCALVAHGQKAETLATGDASNQTSAAVNQGNKSINLESGTRFATSACSSYGSPGLLGGVVNSTTSTVGNVVGGTTSAAGSTVNSTTNAVGSTATSTGRTPGRIQISESSNTSLESGSVLSLQGSNLRLEKGTNFNLVPTQSASTGSGKEQ